MQLQYRDDDLAGSLGQNDHLWELSSHIFIPYCLPIYYLSFLLTIEETVFLSEALSRRSSKTRFVGLDDMVVLFSHVLVKLTSRVIVLIGLTVFFFEFIETKLIGSQEYTKS